MGVNKWRGDALAQSQVDTITIAGTPAAGDTFNVTINSKTLSALTPSPPVQANPSLDTGGSLTVSTIYYWVITAVFSYGETVVSNQKSLTPTMGNQTADLSWAAVSGATGYNIYRSTTSNTYGASSLVTNITSGSTLTYSDDGSATTTGGPPADATAITAGALQAALTVSTAPKEFQEVTWTVSGAVITATAYTAGKPFTVTVSKTSSTGTITHANVTANSGPNDVSIAANWSLGALPSTSVASPPVQAAVTDSITSTTLTNGNTYYWVITATTAAGETTASNEQSHTVATYAPQLSWAAVSGATGYKVYRGNSMGAESTLAATLSGNSNTSYQDTGGGSGGSPPGSNTATVPDDVVFENTSSSALYNLSALASTVLNSLTFNPTFTGTIGLPNVNPSGYYEYRPTWLSIQPTTITLNGGTGAGSGRIKIDCNGQNGVTVLVNGTGSPAEQGVESFLLRNTGTSCSVTVNKGSVAIAPFPGDTAHVQTLSVGYLTNVQSDASVRYGNSDSAIEGGLGTVTTLTQAGGTVTLWATATTVNLSGGTLYSEYGGWTTCNVYGGTVYPDYPTTYTTTTVYAGGTLDLTHDMRATKTFTSMTWNNKCAYNDAFKVGTWTNPVLVNGDITTMTVDLGNNFHLQRS